MGARGKTAICTDVDIRFIGNRLRLIRELKDLSTEDVAHIIGVSKQYVNAVENGVIPSLRYLIKFSREFDVAPNVIFCYDKNFEKKIEEIEKLKVEAFKGFVSGV